MTTTIFTSPHCKSCKIAEKIWRELAQSNNIVEDIRMINVEDDANIVKTRHHNVKSLPTVIITHAGGTFRYEGNVNKRTWIKKMRDYFGVTLV
jgi:glutaredoxin